MKPRSYPPPRKNALAFFLAHINILDWFDKSNYEFKYYESKISSGALNAFHSNKFYAIDAIQSAAYNNHMEVLDWFDKSIYKIDCEALIWLAAKFGRIEILEWLKKSKHKCKYHISDMHVAKINNHQHIMDWFKKN